MPRIETVLETMNHYLTKNIPVSRVPLCKLVLGISLCQRINALVHTKDVLRVSACQKISIIIRGINVRRSVTPVSFISEVL